MRMQVWKDNRVKLPADPSKSLQSIVIIKLFRMEIRILFYYRFPCLMRRHSEPVTAKNKRKMASAQQQSQQPPVAVLSSVNEDAALLQSNQVSSSSVYQNNGVANNWMQNGSIESRIRALSSSNSFRPTKPTFTNWGGSQQYSNQQQNYWPQQQWNTQQTDPQWWNHSAPAQPSEMRPNNPIQPFQNLLQNQPQRPSITVQVLLSNQHIIKEFIDNILL